MNSRFGLQDLLPNAEKRLQAIMNVDKGRIFIVDHEKQVLFRYNQEGEREDYPLSSGIVGQVMDTGQYENTTNGYNSPIFNGRIDIETSMPLITWPIKHPSSSSRDQVIGVFQVINVRGIRGMAHSSKPKFSVFDAENLDFFSKQLAQAVQNNLLYAQLNLEPAHAKSLLQNREVSSSPKKNPFGSYRNLNSFLGPRETPKSKLVTESSPEDSPL